MYGNLQEQSFGTKRWELQLHAIRTCAKWATIVLAIRMTMPFLEIAELHLKIFDMLFDDVVEGGLWITAYFALTSALHSLTQLSRDRRNSDGGLSINEQGTSAPLHVCKMTYAAALRSLCERIHLVIIISSQGNGRRSKQILPRVNASLLHSGMARPILRPKATSTSRLGDDITRHVVAQLDTRC